MYEIYSFCRLVDDVADSDAPHAERRRQLTQWRADIDALYAGRPPAGLAELARVAREFALRKEDFQAVIDGMEMDAVQDIRAPDWKTLDLYCDRVASAVGRLSVRVFGVSEIDGIALAHHLGRALQLTNILRDVDEDVGLGRLYLPREALSKAGIAGDDPKSVLADPALPRVCEAVVARARGHFQEADAIMARNPRRLVRAPRIMGEVYRLILEGMAVRGWSPPRTRVRVGGLRLSWIALQYAIV
jgi:phytoene synthase